jgi:hypothetical protein
MARERQEVAENSGAVALGRMEMDVPETQDWVSCRAKCSLPSMFALLSEVIDSDVKAANANKLGDFRVSTPTDFKRVVIREGESPRGVVFELTRTEITVRDTSPSGPAKHPTFFAAATLGVDGKCRLSIDGASMELWQISKRALEPLFFFDHD